jgi:hypothetical protein
MCVIYVYKFMCDIYVFTLWVLVCNLNVETLHRIYVCHLCVHVYVYTAPLNLTQPMLAALELYGNGYYFAFMFMCNIYVYLCIFVTDRS